MGGCENPPRIGYKDFQSFLVPFKVIALARERVLSILCCLFSITFFCFRPFFFNKLQAESHKLAFSYEQSIRFQFQCEWPRNCGQSATHSVQLVSLLGCWFVRCPTMQCPCRSHLVSSFCFLCFCFCYCLHFRMNESFGFCVCSFTPGGGGSSTVV